MGASKMLESCCAIRSNIRCEVLFRPTALLDCPRTFRVVALASWLVAKDCVIASLKQQHSSVSFRYLSENREMPSKATHRKIGPAPKLDLGRQLNRVRRICGSIPGTIEKISHGEPTFFTPRRVFAMFDNNHHGLGHVAVWIPAAPGVQAALIEEAPATYFRPPYVGVAGWVGVELSKVDDDQLGALIREAFRLMHAKTSSVSKSRTIRPSRPRKRTGAR